MLKGAIISEIENDSIAYELDFQIGDEILSLNNQKPRDIIDYSFLIKDEYLDIELKRKNGEIFGVIPKFFKEENIELIYDKCTELIFTETMAQRKTKMEDLADAFVIVPGGIGTFEEFFEVLTLKQLMRHVKPIAVYDVNGYYKNLDAFLEDAYKEKFIREDCRLLYCYSDDADEILDYIENDKRVQRDVHDLKNG